MAGEKQLFAPVPLRAMADELSGLELRVIVCVAAHDRLSLASGKGQGCRASNVRMAEMVRCNFSRLCSTLSSLCARGYLKQEKLGRHTVYRVIYTDEDRLLFGNVSGRNRLLDRLPNSGVTGCQHTSENGANQPVNGSQYIPLNGGIDLEESREETSSEDAHRAARGLGRTAFAENAGGQIAKLERALNEGRRLGDGWEEWLEDVVDCDENEANRYRAERLIDRVVDALAVQRNGRPRPGTAAA